MGRFWCYVCGHGVAVSYAVHLGTDVHRAKVRRLATVKLGDRLSYGRPSWMRSLNPDAQYELPGSSTGSMDFVR